MKIGTDLPPTSLSPTAAKSSTTSAVQGEQAERLKAAREFEQIFLRKMLSSLEKTGRAKNDGAVSSGGDVYSSMVVGALADAISSAGGIGLADLIVRSTTPKPTSPPVTAALPATGPPPAHDPDTTPLVNEAADFRDRLKLPGRRP
jgi:Rod binding domain-containing protein